MTDETIANSPIDDLHSGNLRVGSSILLRSTVPLVPFMSRLAGNPVQSALLPSRKPACRQQKDTTSSKLVVNKTWLTEWPTDTSATDTSPTDTSVDTPTNTQINIRTNMKMCELVQMSQRTWCIMIKYICHHALCYRASICTPINVNVTPLSWHPCHSTTHSTTHSITESQHHRQALRYAGVSVPVCHLPRATPDMRL